MIDEDFFWIASLDQWLKGREYSCFQWKTSNCRRCLLPASQPITGGKKTVGQHPYQNALAFKKLGIKSAILNMVVVLESQIL